MVSGELDRSWHTSQCELALPSHRPEGPGTDPPPAAGSSAANPPSSIGLRRGELPLCNVYLTAAAATAATKHDQTPRKSAGKLFWDEGANTPMTGERADRPWDPDANGAMTPLPRLLGSISVHMSSSGSSPSARSKAAIASSKPSICSCWSAPDP